MTGHGHVTQLEQDREEALTALEQLVAAWDRFGPPLATVSGKPNTVERARAVCQKLREETEETE